MTLDHTYAEAMLTRPPRVFGLRLVQFSLGHALLLHAVRSPYLTHGERIEFGDFLVALWICSRPFGAARSGLNRWTTRAKLKIWAWQSLALAHRWAESSDAICAWIEEQCAGPEIMVDQAGRELGSGPFHRLKILLQSELGYTEAEVLNLPLRQATWDVDVWAELDDRVQIASARDHGLMAAADAAIADLRRN